MTPPIRQSRLCTRPAAWAAVLGLLVAAACSDEGHGDGKGFLGGEAGVVPECPTASIECSDAGAPPTYTDDVTPILAAHCIGCHGPGGENQDVPLTSYSALMTKTGTSTRAQTAIADVLNCTMPPSPLPRLSEAERTTFVCWFAGGKAK